jgi:hypothetical protein
MRALLLAVAALAGCGSNDSGAHCTLGNACEDYGQTDLAAHEKDCRALTGTWAKGTCPSADQVGTCITDKTITRIYYAGGANAFTTETASASCEHEFHGTWKAR